MKWTHLLAGILSFGLISASWLPGQETETSYDAGSQTETSYDRTAAEPRIDKIAGVNTETSYNPEGTFSNSTIGLLSTRRAAPEYPNFLLGLQNAAMQHKNNALHVAPLSAESLADQAGILRPRGVKTFIVDSPDPAKAKEFFEASKLLERQAVLVTEKLPTDYYPPSVVNSPVIYGERVGEAAIRMVGNNEVEVGYILGGEVNSTMQSSIMRSFLKPFDNVAPKIKLVELDPGSPSQSLVPPSVVCVLTAEASRSLAPMLRESYPDSRIVCVGQSPEVVAAYENGLIDMRVRPDYDRILLNALREARQKSDMPIIVHPAADKRMMKEEN